MENAHPGKCQNTNCIPWNMIDKSYPRKWQKIKFGKCQNENFTPWKIPEWKMHNLENTRMEIAYLVKWQKKYTPQNDRKCTFGICQMENAHHGKCQNGNCTPWKIPEWKMHNLENTRMEIACPGKWQKNHTPEYDRKCSLNLPEWKMPEWKLHTLKNDRKCPPRKIAENSYLENARNEIAHPGKYHNRKCTTWEMPEWKLSALENDRKLTIGIC